MKLNKFKVSAKSLLIVFGFVCSVLIIAGWFYWFEWRPAKIREKCHQGAIDIANDMYKEKAILDSEKERAESGAFLRDDYNSIYDHCLHAKGLK